MARSSLTLDLKAHTGRALNEFKAFSDSLEKKFFVSGLKIDLLKNTLSEINREFDRAMGTEGMRSATELKQLETSSAAVFSVLKGGSLEAGREMAKNIRVALGDVSKSIGSTTEDINSVLRMVPYTSKALLDSAGISMKEFHTENLRMITNVRDAMGEDASKIIEGLLSGETTNTDLLNDKTGIGQLIRTQIGAFDPSAMSPEARTEKVLQILQNDEFQNMIEGLAEDNAGFMRVVRRFRNTLFDPRTGVFGVLKESTLSLREFSGERVTQTTSIFEETTRLFRVIFDPNDGMFARIFKTFGEVFGFNEQNFSDMLIRLIRWVTNVLYNVSQFFSGADFKNFVEGLKGIINFFVTGAQKLSGLFGLTPGGVGAIISNFVGGVGQILKSISEGDWAGAASTASAGIQSAATGLGQTLQNITNNINSGNNQLSAGGALVGGAIGTLFAPGVGTAIGAGIGATLGDDTIVAIVTGAKDIAITVVEKAVEGVGSAVENAGGWEQIGQDTAELITNIGTSITGGIRGIVEKLTSGELDTGGFLDAAKSIFTAIFTQGLSIINEVIDGLIALKDTLGPEGLRPIGAAVAKMFMASLPVLLKGLGFVLTVIEELLSGFISEIITALAPIFNPASWIMSIAAMIARALGFEETAESIEEFRDKMNESIGEFLGGLVTKLLLILNPGGIITKILGKLPLIGKLLTPLYNLLTLNFKAFLPKNFPALFRKFGIDLKKSLIGWARKFLAKAPGARGLFGNILSGVANAIRKSISSNTGRFFFRLRTYLLGALKRRFTGLISNLTSFIKIPSFLNPIKNVLKWLVSKLGGVVKILGRQALSKIPVVGGAIDFAMNKGSGDSNQRAAIKAGTGMAGAMIGGAIGQALIPIPGVGLVIGGVVGQTIGNNIVGGKLADSFGAKYSGNISEYARAANGLNMLASAAALEQQNIRPGAKPVIANSDEIIIPPGRLSEVRFAITDQVGSTIESILNRQPNMTAATTGVSTPLSSFSVSRFDKDLSRLGETFDEYGEESEDSWLKSLDSASKFFTELNYKTSVEWKNAISKPLQVSAPSVQVDTSEIETSIKSSVEGINFGDIFSKVPEGLTSGWDNLVNFFEEAGKKAKEFLSGREDGKWRWPWETPKGYNGNRLNTANTGFNLAGFTAAAQEEVLNSGFSSNIVVANDTEIIAPKSSLNQLASLLLRQSDVGRSGASASVSNENHIVFNINGATDPDAVAAAVMQKMDLALSHTMMNNRVPHA